MITRIFESWCLISLMINETVRQPIQEDSDLGFVILIFYNEKLDIIH